MRLVVVSCMNKHVYEGDEHPYGRHTFPGIPVAELLQRAIDEGRPLYLEWPEDRLLGTAAEDDTQVISPVNDWFSRSE